MSTEQGPETDPDPATQQGPERDEDPAVGRPRWRGIIVLAPLGLLVLLGAAYGVDLALAGSDIPRGTTVAGVGIGGLSPAQAQGRLTEQVEADLLRDRPATAGTVEFTVDPTSSGIALDVDATIAAAGAQPLNPFTRLGSLFGDARDVEPELRIDQAALDAAMTDLDVGVDPIEGTIEIDGTTAMLVAPVDGQRLDVAAAGDALVAAVRADEPSVDFAVQALPTQVSEQAVQETLDEFVIPALAGPVVLTGPANGRVELPVAVIASSLRFAPGPERTLVATLDPAALRTAAGPALDPFTAPAQDAGFVLQGGAIQIVPAVDGTTTDFAALATGLLEVLPAALPRELAAPLTPQPAELTTDEARALGITEQVSTFTTNFTNENSGENIRVVAAEVDGAVVLPGETFSLNGFTGPRTEAEGYVESTIIDGGEFVQAVGGGISQFATTMFNAVFFAGLEDVYHKPHSYYISRYPAGREATVFYDSIDLSWHNDSETGIYVQTVWEPGAITVTFWGTRHFDIESVSGERFNFSYPETERKPDDGDCAAQTGSEGFDIAVTRVFHPVDGAAVLREEVFNTRYNAVPEIVCVDPARADDPEPP